jgi:hypothetical protein
MELMCNYFSKITKKSVRKIWVDENSSRCYYPGKFFAKLTIDLDVARKLHHPHKIEELVSMSTSLVESFTCFEPNGALPEFLAAIKTISPELRMKFLESGRRLKSINEAVLTEFKSGPRNFFFPAGQLLWGLIGDFKDPDLEYLSNHQEIKVFLDAAPKVLRRRWKELRAKFTKIADQTMKLQSVISRAGQTLVAFTPNQAREPRTP